MVSDFVKPDCIHLSSNCNCHHPEQKLYMGFFRIPCPLLFKIIEKCSLQVKRKEKSELS